MNPLIQLEKAALAFLVPLVCFGILPKAQAVSPAPDGGYPGGNTAEGQAALLSLTTGGFNTAVGYLSLRSNTTNSFNTAVGVGALFLNTADENTATGTGALLSNTIGTLNTANGAFALQSNSTGFQNTANGAQALYLNTIGSFNTANGISALFNNTTGGDNTANGGGALYLNTTGSFNTADGFEALHNNNGDSNTADGYHALYSNVGGGNNTGIGDDALFNNTTGQFNTATGGQALQNNTTGGSNTATGANALALNTTGIGNTAIGISAGINITTASNAICIGADGANVSNSCFIGNIRGVTTAITDAIPVLIDSAGQLGTTSSSARFKHEIKPMDKASEAILALKPVTFHYKGDTKDTPQFGLIAEDVAAVNRDLVVRDKNGEIYTVRYDAVNAMLLNEFLKEHSTVQELQKELAALSAIVKEQASQIQKVTAQLELNKPGPQTVVDTQ